MDAYTRQELTKGLTSEPLYIPSWYRYDYEGSRLNDICLTESKWYYFSRFEENLLRATVEEITRNLTSGVTLVDLGSGNAVKTRLFIDQLLKHNGIKTYIPVDISLDYLKKTTSEIRHLYGDAFEVEPVGGEYLIALKTIREFPGQKLILWFGSLQNLSHRKQVIYLKEISDTMKCDDRLLITIDVTDYSKKDIIKKAYLDPDGYCRNLNCNSIRRINREMNGNIDLSKFVLKNEFIIKTSNNDCSYIQMWMEALEDCTFTINNLQLTLRFQKGDKLFLHEPGGLSCKYTIEQIKYICDEASLSITDYWKNEHVMSVLMRKK